MERREMEKCVCGAGGGGEVAAREDRGKWDQVEHYTESAGRWALSGGAITSWLGDAESAVMVRWSSSSHVCLFPALASCHQPGNLNSSNCYLSSEIKVLTRWVLYEDCKRGPVLCFYFSFFGVSGILWLRYCLFRLQEFWDKSSTFQDSQRTRLHPFSHMPIKEIIEWRKTTKRRLTWHGRTKETVSLSLSSRYQWSIGRFLSSGPCLHLWRSCPCCYHLRGVSESHGMMTPVPGCSLTTWVTGFISSYNSWWWSVTWEVVRWDKSFSPQGAFGHGILA